MTAAGNDTVDATNCDGAYKVSYLEKAADNYFVGAGIYLDANNVNESNGNELTVIRQRVRTAVGLLRGEEIAEGEKLSSLFADGSEFILNANPVDQSDMVVDPEAYIFVWENR